VASKTTTAAPAEVESVEVLDMFEEQLVTVEGVSSSSDHRAILSKVIFGGVIGGMYGALDEDLAPVKDDAPASEKSARKDMIRQRIMSYIHDKCGRYYSWSNLDAWRKAGVVNATLPERVRVTMTLDPSGDPDKAVLSGVWSVWALTYLGQIEDEAVRASSAEALYDAGNTGETAAKAEADRVNGKTPTPLEPKAASLLIDALVKSVRKSDAGTVGKIEHICTTVDADDALALIDFGRLVYSKTRADAGETDKDTRNRKRLEVFRGAAEQLAAGTPDDEDDGAVQPGDTPVL